jgi:ABC-type branched-subunit amino acid transport system substrate-binding protein
MLAVCLVAACGARLTDEQRVAALRGRGSGASRGASSGAAAGDLVDEASASGSATGDGGAGATGGGGGSSGGASAAATASRPLPAGGNGGATDTGVTATQITIAVLSDRTGPVPGLFESTIQAVTAWANMVNSGGGVYGRKIKVLPIDSKTSTNDNRAGALQACEQAFALVGSMSAYDDGGAGPIGQCGIPDISTTTVNASRDEVKTVFPADPNTSNFSMIGMQKLLAERFPEAPKTAAEVWLNAAVTRSNAAKNMQATQSIGFNYVYTRQVEVVEPNFTPYVVEMRNKNVQYVSMVSDNNAVARLLKAFQSQNYKPQVMQFDTVIYDQAFLKTAGAAAEGVFTFVAAVPLEEAASNKEYTLYLDWLKRSSGGQANGFFGLYAWSAGRLFQEGLDKVGPQLTRAKLLQFLQGTHSWDGHGLHPGHDIGNKRIANCFVLLQVKGGKFTRYAPAQGFDCDRVPVYENK